MTFSYVHSFTEKIQRIFTKHRVATVVKPQTTLRRQVLVHPKDKVDKQKNVGVVYKIPCNQCEKGIHWWNRETAGNQDHRTHRREAEKIPDRNFTRSTHRASTNEHHKSAITDHVCQNKQDLEGNKFRRWIKKSKSDQTLLLWTGMREPISFLPYGHKWSPPPNQGRRGL